MSVCWTWSECYRTGTYVDKANMHSRERSALRLPKGRAMIKIHIFNYKMPESYVLAVVKCHETGSDKRIKHPGPDCILLGNSPVVVMKLLDLVQLRGILRWKGFSASLLPRLCSRLFSLMRKLLAVLLGVEMIVWRWIHATLIFGEW